MEYKYCVYCSLYSLLALLCSIYIMVSLRILSGTINSLYPESLHNCRNVFAARENNHSGYNAMLGIIKFALKLNTDCENFSKPLNFSWGTSSPGKWSQHRTCLSAGSIWTTLSDTFSCEFWGVIPLSPHSFSNHQPSTLGAGHLKQIWTTGMLEWVMAQKFKSKHTLWAILNINPWKGGGGVLS